MGNNKEMANISKATIGRLPAYHRYLTEKKAEGERTVSSTAIAEALHLSAVQVRKDLAAISSAAGKPKLGFDVGDLIADIDRLLGYDNVSDAVLVGAGGLGSALVGYDGFKNYGLNIVAAFDCDPARIGRQIGGVRVYDVRELQHLVRRRNVRIGIIAVPRGAAKQVADELIEGGVRALWNFAPMDLKVPEGVVANNVHLTDSLLVLTYRLQNEYNVEVILEKLPFEYIRWIENPQEVDVARIQGTSDMKRIKDLKGNPLLLFINSWSVGMVLERNPDLKLAEFGRA